MSRSDKNVDRGHKEPQDTISRGRNELPPFAALRAFDAVFRTGGVRSAARLLSIDHAVVSRHLRFLEDWLSIALICRSGSGLTLTEEGRRYHGRVSAALAELHQATQDILGARDEAPVRLWCVPGLAIQWLSARIGEFEAAHTDFRVELKSSDRPANLSIYEADADIRFIYFDKLRDHLPRGSRIWELASPEIIAVASPAVAERFLASCDSSNVSSWPLLHEDSENDWRTWLRARGFPIPEKLRGVLCWHAHLLIAAAREGRGIALSNRFLVRGELERGQLVEILAAPLAPVKLGSYALMAREDQWSTPALMRLRNFLQLRAREILTLERG